MEKKNLSLAEYRETGEILDRMRKYLIVLFIADLVVFFLLTLSAMILNMDIENEFVNGLTDFLMKHSLILTLITFAPSLATLLYCVAMLRLYIFDMGLLIAGTVAFFTAVYQKTVPALTSNTMSNGLASIIGGGALVLVMGIVFRKLYCDAMCKATSGMDAGIGENWRRLWKLSLIVSIVGIVLLVVLNFYAEDVIKKINDLSYNWYGFDDSGLSYSDLLARLSLVSMLIANIAVLADLILMAFEMKCLKKTRAGVLEKCSDLEVEMSPVDAADSYDANL